MGLKAKDLQSRLADLRDENKDNPMYPKLRKINENTIEVIINEQKFTGTSKDVLNKFKDVPYFMEEYDDLMTKQDDFISYNMQWIEQQLKSKYN